MHVTALHSAVLAGVVAFIAAASRSSAQRGAPRTVDAIVARHIAARGGLARIEAVRTERLVGRASFGPGAEGIDTVEIARPTRIRTWIRFGDKTLIQAFDGHTAWTLNGLRGDTVARVMSPDAAKNVAAGADMDGPLVHYARKGNRIELGGIDTASGRPAYKLIVHTASGLSDTYYIDTVSFLQTKWEGERVVNGARVVFESFFRDYRDVDSVMLAFRIDSDTKGRPGGQHLRFDTITVNLPIADSRFAMPAGSPSTIPHS